MIVYFSVLVFAPTLLLFGRKKNSIILEISDKKYIYRNYSKNFIYLSYLYILIFAGIRYYVGPDYKDYIAMYDATRVYGFEYLKISTIEPGYWLICFILSRVFNNGFWHFGFISAITYWFIYKWILKNTKKSAFALYLFLAFGYYVNAFMGIRQWLAISVLLLAYTYLKEMKYIKSVILVLVAGLFHYSALTALPVFLFVRKARKRLTHILLFGIGIFFYLFYNLGLSLIENVLHYFSWFGSSGKYLSYLDSSIWLQNGNVLANPLFCLITYVLVWMHEKRMIKRDPNICVYINLVVVAFCVSIIGQRIYIFNRLQLYFVPIIVVLLTNVAEAMTLNDHKIYVMCCLALGFAFFVYFMITGAAGGLPYMTIFTLLF